MGQELAFLRQLACGECRGYLYSRPLLAKAFGALSLGMGGRMVTKHAIDRPHFMQGLSGVSGGKVVPVPGGVLIRDAQNAIIGAVGISGDTSDNDEAAAVAGIEAAGFTAEP